MKAPVCPGNAGVECENPNFWPSLVNAVPNVIERNLLIVPDHSPNENVVGKKSLLDGKNAFFLNGSLWGLLNLAPSSIPVLRSDQCACVSAAPSSRINFIMVGLN